MATPIAAVVLASPSRKSVRLHTYVSTEKEGQKKGDRFVAQSGLNGCIPEFAERQFRDNRKRWGKNADRTVERGGRRFVEGQYVQAYHLIQSFARDGVGALDPASSDDWEKAHELGMLLAKRVAGEGRMATVTTQIDGKTGCLHNHIVIDSVDKLTGRSFDSAGVKHKLLAAAHDEVLKDAGYEQVNTLTNGAVKVEKSELRAAAKHAEWEADPTSSAEPFSVAVLKKRIREAMSSPRSFDLGMFMRECHRLGVDVQRSTARNGQGLSYRMMRLEDADQGTYLPPARGDVRRAAKLGTEFTMDAVQAAIVRNVNAPRQHQATTTQPTTPVPDKSEKTAPSASAAGMASTDDLTEKSTSYAAAPDMPVPASTPLPQAAKKANPLADLWSDWEADRPQRTAQIMADLGLGKSLEQIDAEKAAEAPQEAPEPVAVTEVREQVSEPVEDEKNAVFATATDLPTAPASTPLPQAADKPYRSRLWEFESDTPSALERAHRLAAYEEIAVPLLEAGERLDDSVLTSIGVRESVMKKLGPFMNSDFREQLEMRAKKLTLARKLHEGNMQPAAKRLRAEVAAGVYETVAVKSARKRVRLSAPQERQIEDDGMSL